jgi:undecaprenyl-diphosphatase
MLAELERIDRAVYRAVAATPTPALDAVLRRSSRVADRSVLWTAIALGLSFTGPQGRRAAARGMASVALTSAVVNLGLKPLHRRRRPDNAPVTETPGRSVPMPRSASFPSGHSASAFAFATAVGSEIPALALPLRALAATVAYSRVHGGAHYPADVIAGSLIGGAAATFVARVPARL